MQENRTALVWAAARGHTDCARLLMDQGADKEARTLVRVAASVVDRSVCVVFMFVPIAKRIHVLLNGPRHAMCLLCVDHCHVFERVYLSFYLRCGRGKCIHQDGFTPLICASIFGHKDCVRLLMASGADKEAKTNVRFGDCSFVHYVRE